MSYVRSAATGGSADAPGGGGSDDGGGNGAGPDAGGTAGSGSGAAGDSGLGAAAATTAIAADGDGGDLPFTGLGLAALLLAGVALVGGGVLLRRTTRS